MNLDSSFMGRLGRSLQTSHPVAGDSLLQVPPLVTLIIPLGSPMVELNPGQTIEQGGQTDQQTVHGPSTVGTTDLLMTLNTGVWRVRIQFGSVQDFSGFGAGAHVDIRVPTLSGPQAPIMRHHAVANVPNYTEWDETIYLQVPTDFVLGTPATAAAQNAVASVQMFATRLL